MEINRRRRRWSGTKETNNSKDKKATDSETDEKVWSLSNYPYLTEEDLQEALRGGLTFMKSLENTVTSAINKHRMAHPAGEAYPSIHAAYQLPNIMKTIPAQLRDKFSSEVYVFWRENPVSYQKANL